MREIMKLDFLWKEVAEINKQHFPSNLVPIIGNGETNNPKVMFLFINPTHVNISSRSDWKGPCFPFCGTKQIWRIFHRAGLFDDSLMQEIESVKEWSVDLAERVLAFLKKQSFYFTNVVKWTGSDAGLPNSKKIELFLPILKKEIKIVNPERIVAFGLIPFKALMKKELMLQEYFELAMREKVLKPFEYEGIKVFPCYFPIGRGNPKRAVDLLKLLRTEL